MRRVLALAAWAYLVWVLLTWTRTAEQLLVGAAAAALVAVALAPFGAAVAPWRLLHPVRLARCLRLLVEALGLVLLANLRLARRIWSPSRPLRSGMVIVPTAERSDAGLAAVGLITSMIVECQLVDIDRHRHELLYHTVAAPDGDPEQVRREINGRIERLLGRLEGRVTDD